MTTNHIPVMKAEVLQLLRPRGDGWIVDATVGSGGHAQAILSTETFTGMLLGLDRDRDALAMASQRLEPFADRVRLRHAEFDELAAVLRRENLERVDGLLLDLGVSSMQLDAPDRGFSFLHDGPLDMRMDTTRGNTLGRMLDRIDPAELERILREYGEERHARRIATAILDAHRSRRLQTTGQLAEVVAKAIPRRGGYQRIHPATRTFMALRILVNDELTQLEHVLSTAKELLRPEGRLVVLSYHSLEDRIVKQTLRAQAKEGAWTLLSRKPLRPDPEESRTNPRSRSAKLRAAERTGHASAR